MSVMFWKFKDGRNEMWGNAQQPVWLLCTMYPSVYEKYIVSGRAHLIFRFFEYDITTL